MIRSPGRFTIGWLIVACGSLGAAEPVSVKLDVVFIGDSITESKTPVETAADFLKSCRGVEDVRTSNQGRSGHTTLDFLPADSPDSESVSEAANAFVSPDRELVFSIMLGANDSACKGPNGAPVSPATYKANLKAIADRLLSAYPRAKVVFQYPLWYSANTYNRSCYLAEGQKRLRSYWPEITALSAAYGRSHPNRVFQGSQRGWAHFEKHHLTDMRHENGQQGVFFLHPNEQGSRALGLFWAEAIRRAVIGMEKVVFHVGPGGNDAGDGSETNPFATLARARDAVRSAKEAGPLTGGAEIRIQAGRYTLASTWSLSADDSGLSGAPVVYVATPGTVVTGAKRIPPTAFSTLGSDFQTRIQASARAQVRCADLSLLGFPQSPRVLDCFRLPFAVPELFFNGKRMTLACWPNNGWATIDSIIEQGTMRNDGSVSDAADPNKKRATDNRGGVFTYPETDTRPGSWNVADGVWLHGFWCFDWYDEAIKVAAIDPVKREILLKAAHQYGLRQGNPSPRRWRAVNLIEELDSPGEYFISRDANRLYFWPPGELADARVTLATRDEPLVTLSGVSHVTLQGMTFEEAQGDALAVRDCCGVVVDRCVIRNIRRKAIHVEGGSGNIITRCNIHDTGTGGVYLGGGDRKTLTPAGHRLENSHIWNFSVHQLTYASGLHFAGVGQAARHNWIHDAPHQAVSVSGNDHLFEYNVVSNVCMSSDDAAAFYKGRNPSCRGNVIRFNLWSMIGSPRGHGNAAIYFDDGDGGDMVFGNLFYRCGDPGKGAFGTVFSHGGHGNQAENNIFIDCKRALGSAPWSDKRWKDFINAPLWQARLLSEVDITKPPYSERYPELSGFMDPQAGTARDNCALRNLFVNCGEVKNNRWLTNETDVAVADDPAFTDIAAKGFLMDPEAPVFKRIPGFLPLPVERMGVRE